LRSGEKEYTFAYTEEDDYQKAQKITMRKILTIITAAIILVVLIWGFFAYNRWYNHRSFERIVAEYKEESIPGKKEIYTLYDKGLLTLNDLGEGTIKIVLWDIEGNGIITWKPEEYQIILEFWSVDAQTDEIQIPHEHMRLALGDELDFGGYHFKIKDFTFVNHGRFNIIPVLFLEVTLPDDD
jgi:hypothetical protein